MRRAWLCVVVAGCVKSSSLECPGDLVCPPTNVCRTIEQEDTCVLGDWVKACEGMGRPDGEACDAANPSRHCVDGVCIVTCGNGFLDPAAGEDCDDGNLAAGDGCSKTCHFERCGNGELDPQDGELCDDGGPPVSGDGCSSTCRPETAAWRDITPAPLSARAGMAAANAEGLGVDVLFGGTGLDGTSGQTWLYDGSWRLTNPASSPPPRTLASMVWDPAHQRMVLFGGIGAGGALADTWTWQVEPNRPLATATWTQLAPAHAPPGRYKHALGYDAVRDRVVAFGGTDADGNGLADVWEFDGTDWSEKHPATTLPALGMAAMAFHHGNNQMLLCQPGQHAQIWDGAAWTDQGLAGCPTQPGFAMVWSQSKSNVYMVSPNAGSYILQAWTAGLWLTNPLLLAKPPTRLFPVWIEAAYGNILLFGGSTYGNLDDRSQLVDDAWILGDSWAAQPEPVVVPEARAHAAIAYDDARGRIVLTGGMQGTQLYADTWMLDGEGWRALPIATDTAVADGALAYDVARGAIVRFGGRTASGLSAAVAELAATDDAWTAIAATGPSARAGVALAYDGAQVVAFGGETAAGVVGETWRWNGAAWTSAPAGPSPRRRAAATYDVARRRLVLFGGGLDTTSAAFANDTWEWDGTAWTLAATAQPPAARAGATLTYDPLRHVSVLMGGADATTTFADRWEWDGHAWKQVADDPSRARSDAAAAYHAVLGGLVLFGGARGPFGGLAGSVELLRYDGEVPRETCRHATDDLDGDGLAGCADPDCWARCTPGCPPGATCPTLPHCGDGTCSAIEDAELCPADCAP